MQSLLSPISSSEPVLLSHLSSSALHPCDSIMKSSPISIVLMALVTICHSGPSNGSPKAPGDMWIADIEHGISSFHARPDDYQVYRNVMDFGCKGDGVTDDTLCINTAISSGARCGENCGSSTISPAIVYFPAGQYVVSTPIIMYYFTQMVGNALDHPTIIAAPNFGGMAMIDTDPYLPGGGQWYINQNNFFRQIRNFVLDTTRTPAAAGTTGIHWQVAQATSLVNIHFKMSMEPGNQHQGIWMENGSGGFMSDLVFEGGKFGMWVGNQQFLSRNMEFRGCQTAIYMNWNWQWTFKNIQILNCGIGIDMTARSDVVTSGIGSILLLDSTISDTPIGVALNGSPPPIATDVSGSLLLDNVRVNNVPVIVQDATNSAPLLPGGGSQTITSWGRGSRYNDQSGVAEYTYGNLPAPNKSPSLLDGQGNFFEQSRPQYEEYSAADFASVKAAGARGDGVTDDSDAIQAVINANVNGKIVFFPAGSYIIGKTVTVPPGSRLTGETWSVLMAGGAAFQDEMAPQPMIKVGEPGQAGMVQITDLMFSTKGAQPGAILVQWNMRQTTQGSAAMWDAHFRVGGTQGSNLQVTQCPKGQSAVPECTCAHTLLHLTPTSSAYLENVWAWTADHDLDNHIAQGQVSIYVGRGVLIESTEGPVWLYGTQSEHNVFYQYQLVGANNVFMTMIQSETPYWQSGPPAPLPFRPNLVLNDPGYAHCAAGDIRCAMSWSIRAVRSSNVYVYGAGMYNFFNNYDQTCLTTEDCQTGMVTLENVSNFYMYNANTKAAVNSIVADNTRVLVKSLDNRNGFCQTINAFLTYA